MKLTSFFANSNVVLEVHSALKTKEISSIDGKVKFDKKSKATATLGQDHASAFSDLVRYASKEYDLSDDFKDYLIVPVPTIITSTPNKNGVGFPVESLRDFSPEHGMPRFKTWVGKPTFYEHKNDNVKEAKGIILDSVMNPIRGYPGFFKVVKLLSFDRTKDPILYDKIASKKLNSYSMGCYVDMYKCSKCGSRFKTGDKFSSCPHIDANSVNFYIDSNGSLVYKQLMGIQGFETSAVEVPAFRPAISDFPSIMDPQIRTKSNL